MPVDATGEMPTPNTSGVTPQTPSSETQTTNEVEELRAALKRANAESAERRKRLEQLEADEKKRNDAQLTEVEKATKRADAAEARLAEQAKAMRERSIRHAVEIEASRAGFIAPDDAAVLADLSGVQYDETTGQVSGVDAAVKALAKAKPHLVKQSAPAPNIDGRAGGKGTLTGNQDELIQRKRASGNYTPL